ncbi:MULTISPECIES: FadR/GntR family transcriptional regulator [Microbacterium]|jgi:DNA-binding FadR family transcriptional regulator|uniref:FadR/GntR family transcriptional regulator n=1 Tax=Microbacterium TaxID=33882 RepID=UPI0023DA57B2|nr:MULTISPECIES: FadR/GntR family transcriptional regulator [Microbacterium]MDF2045673.1 FadR/GntR family transcriptional regulator [Microbacterium sp. Kw_RZR3]MDQ1074914.1 GntR family transcriptional repressor for pyruvate dehydrogenase complex [Microbacterium sp. SORGH_AS_0969]MDQ1115139.1 GntR family transcriptional repressor for pyruvate dehydrogenase complex [Microbacterium testaceum]
MAVTDEAILKIKDMIVSGEVGPGGRLPPEKDLSERLGLSRNSLREAVKALEVIKVLDVRRGDGTYVTSLQPDLLLEAMSFVVDLHQNDSILEVLAVRRLLEPRAVALAARAITDAQIAELTDMIEGVRGDTLIDQLVAHDVEFHGRIAESTGNTYLASLLETLSGQTVRARIWRGITEGGSVDRTIDEHRRILDALRARDAELAEALMLAHVSGVEHWLRAAS